MYSNGVEHEEFNTKAVCLASEWNEPDFFLFEKILFFFLLLFFFFFGLCVCPPGVGEFT